MLMSARYDKLPSRNCKRMHGPFGWRYYAVLYAVEARRDNLFKIGRTIDIQKRYSGLCTMSPTPLILRGHVWLPDSAECEAHQYLKPFRAHGEWFEGHPMVKDFVDLIERKKVLEVADLLEMTWMIPQPERDSSAIY